MTAAVTPPPGSTPPVDADVQAQGQQPAVLTFFSDTWLIFRRQIRLSLRNPAWVIIGLVQPILYLAFFGPLLSMVAAGSVAGFPPGNSYSFFVPGLLIQLGLFGAAFVGF